MIPQLTVLKLGFHTVKEFKAPPHVRRFQELYNELIYGDEWNRLAISAPVRHAKSWTFSWLGMAAYLLNHPERRVLYLAYEDLAEEYGGKVRQTIEDYGPRLTGVRLNRANRSKTNFRTIAGGGLTAKSAGSSISGFGYDLIVLDDVQKKQEETDNEAMRLKIWNWFYSDVCNRSTPEGKIIAVMARRHPQDIMGMLQEQTMMEDLPQSKRWNFQIFKAIQDDGTALWPEEWSIEKLRDTEKDYELAGTSYLFNCLYQSDPMVSPAGLEWDAKLFDGIEYDEIPAGTRFIKEVVALDPSKGKHAHKGDFAAMCHLLIDSTGCVYIDDCALVRLPGPFLEDRFISWMETHRHDGAAIESDLDNGSMAEQIGRKLIDKNRLDLQQKIWSMPSQGQGDKSERLRRYLSRLLCNRKLKIRRTGHYRLMLSQFRNFSPHGKDHDDGPDSVAIGVRCAIELSPVVL
jgi:hypothetical protein